MEPSVKYGSRPLPGVAALKRVPDDIPVVALSGIRETRFAQAVIDETKAAEELRKYRHGLKAMSGGLTVSGGEPLG